MWEAAFCVHGSMEAWNMAPIRICFNEVGPLQLLPRVSQKKPTSQDPKNPIMSNQLVSAVVKSHFLVLCRCLGGTALLKKSTDRLLVEFGDVVDG